MKNETIIATDEQVENLQNVNSISHIDTKKGCIYTVNFFDGTQQTYFVKE